MKQFILILSLVASVATAQQAEWLPMVEIPAGHFYQGSLGEGEDYDEAPVHRVTISHAFRMGQTEVTNAQFEAFCPEHRALRGTDGISMADDEPVV